MMNYGVKSTYHSKLCHALANCIGRTLFHSSFFAMTFNKKFQMLFEQNIASNLTRNAGAQTYKT